MTEIAWTASDQEIRAMVALAAPKRYDYFVKRAAGHGELSGLRDSEGWVMAGDEAASDAMAQFTPAEVGTGSAGFNSLRQLGAAMGVAVPGVVFELIAGGSRTPDATLDGSTGAFAIRLVVLAIPLLLVLGRPLLERGRAAPAPA